MNREETEDCKQSNGWIKSFEKLYNDLLLLPNSKNFVKIGNFIFN